MCRRLVSHLILARLLIFYPFGFAGFQLRVCRRLECCSFKFFVLSHERFCATSGEFLFGLFMYFISSVFGLLNLYSLFSYLLVLFVATLAAVDFQTRILDSVSVLAF